MQQEQMMRYATRANDEVCNKSKWWGMQQEWMMRYATWAN